MNLEVRRMRTELPRIFEVSCVRAEGKGQQSIFLKGDLCCTPGQFVMVWLPGVDEKPMAISYAGNNEFAFAYHTIGTFTEACDKLKAGDNIGIRGPYGNSFSVRENAVVVAGGVGMSSVSTLIDVLKNPVILHGARDKDHLMYLSRYKDKEMICATDDGSYGHKGYITDVLRDILTLRKVGVVYTCGPELMIKKVVEICSEFGVDCEASLERYMKCGFGICGNCLIDDNILCTEGPIFGIRQLIAMKEFGVSARLKTGKKVPLKEYYSK